MKQTRCIKKRRQQMQRGGYFSEQNYPAYLSRCRQRLYDTGGFGLS